MKHVIITAAVIFFIAFLRMFVISGLSNNTIYLFIFTAAFFTYRLFFDKLVKLSWLNCAIAAGFLCFIGFSLFLAVYGRNDNVSYGEDVLLVLGCGIKGEEVSVTLMRRLEKAVEYHEKNPGALIIVSGGQGPNEDIPEALAMERYLTGRGVPSEKIIKERQSLSTYENIYYSKRIIDRLFPEPPSIAIITTDFHIYRGERFAEAAGIDAAHLHSVSAWYTVPANYARECAAVLKMWLINK